jgi:hypothetical protein
MGGMLIGVILHPDRELPGSIDPVGIGGADTRPDVGLLGEW